MEYLLSIAKNRTLFLSIVRCVAYVNLALSAGFLIGLKVIYPMLNRHHGNSAAFMWRFDVVLMLLLGIVTGATSVALFLALRNYMRSAAAAI